MTNVSVRPTGARRGAHSERGRPISVSAIGVAISRPARSPIHQVAQVNSRPPAATVAVASKRDARQRRRDQAARDARRRERPRRRAVRVSVERLAHEAAAPAPLPPPPAGPPPRPTHDRHDQRAEGMLAARLGQLEAHEQRAERDRSEHSRPVDEHAGEGDAGGGVQRRRVTRRQRQQQRQQAERQRRPSVVATNGSSHARTSGAGGATVARTGVGDGLGCGHRRRPRRRSRR